MDTLRRSMRHLVFAVLVACGPARPAGEPLRPHPPKPPSEELSQALVPLDWWLGSWRADHGDGVGWNENTSENGIVVNGDRVTAYGLFVEHFQKHQTLWNGEAGRVYFYQSETPYDAPNQAAWQHPDGNGYASYKLAPEVTTHELWGGGVYGIFHNSVVLDNAFETPTAPGIGLHHLVTMWLGFAPGSEISHIVNGTGDAVHDGSEQAKTSY